MVDSIKPTYRPIPVLNPTSRRDQTTQGVETHTDEKRVNTKLWRGRDRRKNPDRRNEHGNRPVYESRSSRGRRASDIGTPRIDIDA